jgi:hypothetical protein
MWLNQLKIAIIEKNTERLSALMDELPTLEDPQEIETALCLLKEATLLVEGLRDETQNSMLQMKKNIDFLKSTQANKTAKFDITS